MNSSDDGDDSSSYEEHWASWFCSLAGNKFFCDIDKSYIEDNFNLYGLKAFVTTDYNKAMDTILDRLGPNEQETEDIARSAALLYGLIHARYIITTHGLDSMHRKYIKKEFGECPRMLCRGQAVLPIGVTDEPKQGIVKLFCPKCQDVYNCNASQRHIDGSYFGTTFPNLFFMTYEDLVPEPATEHFVPKVFGFRIHSSSNSLPKLKNDSSENASQNNVEAPITKKRSLSDAVAEPELNKNDIGFHDTKINKSTEKPCASQKGNGIVLSSGDDHKSKRPCP